jgi:hypothetical protein
VTRPAIQPPDPPFEAPFEARLLTAFHRMVPDVTVVLTGQPTRPALFGVHAAQVSEQTTAAMDTALRTLAQLWPVLTGGLPAPPTVRTEWRQEAGYTSSVVAVASSRHHAVPADKVRRVAAAHAALIAGGWDTRRRDPRFPRYLRLLGRRGGTAVEVSVRSRPNAYDVEVCHGPVLVGGFGAELLRVPAQSVRLPPVEP